MPTQARTASSRQFFGRGGTLSRWHPKYEFRPGQVEMAEAVESALADKRHLIVEAGTGTGKIRPNLVPGCLPASATGVSTVPRIRRNNLSSKTFRFFHNN